jgi:hypothetical protein
MGFDLNRVWQDPSPWAHPELFAAKSQVLGYDKDPVKMLFFHSLLNNQNIENIFVS